MAARKTIALCLEYPLALRGGVSVLVETLVEGLAPHFDLVVVSPDSPEELTASPAAALLKKHLPWDPTRPSRARAALLAGQIAAAGVDLAHFHLGGNYGWGNRFPGQSPISHLRRHGVPVVSSVHLVVHPLDGYCGPQKPLWFKLALLPLAWAGKMQTLGHERREIAVSQHDCGKLRRWYWPLRGRYEQIYHSRLRQATQPAPDGPREKAILNVGHLAMRKGQQILAAAFAQIAPRHPDWKLWLVGPVVEEGCAAEIRAIAEAAGISDRVLLPGGRNDAYDWMSRAGIYVQPSLAEALGLALQEAMFRGCPAIGARAGGIPELIDHGRTGHLVAAGSVAELAQSLETYIQSPALRDQFSRAGARSMIDKGMTYEQMLARHVQLYQRVLGLPPITVTP